MITSTLNGHLSYIVVNIIMPPWSSLFGIMIIIIPTQWWSLGHCDQHYPQQHTLLETYGQINLSDVQYHSSANNKSNNFVFAECPVIIAITACISAPLWQWSDPLPSACDCLETEVLISPQNWVPAKLEKFERKVEDKEIFIKVWKIRFSWIILPHYIKFQPETHPSKEHAVNGHPSKGNPSKELQLMWHPVNGNIQLKGLQPIWDIQPTRHPSKGQRV